MIPVADSGRNRPFTITFRLVSFRIRSIIRRNAPAKTNNIEALQRAQNHLTGNSGFPAVTRCLSLLKSIDLYVYMCVYTCIHQLY
jgi:hypothetical protein